MEKVHLLTLGCPKNLADSELMLGALTSAGFEITLDPEEAQVLLVNTCAFIEAAKKESIDAILEAAEVKKRGFGKRLVVAGCLSQRYATELAATMPEVDVFVGTGNFLDLPELLRRTEAPESRPIPYAGAAHLLPTSAIPRVKTGDFFTSYLKISEGCNHKCAFCIIPKIRGLHESRPLADLVAEAHNLAVGGVREINLIAQDLTAYGRDLNEPSSLAALLRELSTIDELRWIRLLYCYPNFVTAELLDAIAELPKVVKYIDMPLQHADDAMLRAMRRERSALLSSNCSSDFRMVVEIVVPRLVRIGPGGEFQLNRFRRVITRSGSRRQPGGLDRTCSTAAPRGHGAAESGAGSADTESAGTAALELLAVRRRFLGEIFKSSSTANA